MFGLDEAAARDLLLANVTAAAEGRAKPVVKPGFPGAGRAVPAAPRFPGVGPQVWNVPPHNPHFTGRGAELADLARGLTGGSTVTVHSVHGLGGVGKTQLASEYAHARAADYEVAWWVAAKEASLIPDQFAGLARQLGLDPATEPDLVRTQVHERLREVAGWLLVFDNADDADGIRPWLPATPLPGGVPGHVLVTTRRSGFGSLGAVLNLDVISLPDAVRLLRTRVPGLDQAIGEAIAAELGQLPLALEQAAAYMDRTGLPGAEYLDLLRSRAAQLYERGRVASRVALRLLQADALGQIQNSPQTWPRWQVLLPHVLAATAHTNSDTVTDPTGLDDTARLLDRAGTYLRVHARLAEARPLYERALAITEAACGPDHPRVATCLNNLAGTVRVLGKPGQARPLYERALAIDEAAYGPDHPEVGIDLNNLAETLRDLGVPGQAQPLLERALAITEAAYGPDHPDVAIRLNNLALTLQDLGEPGQARPLLERAAAIDGKRHSDGPEPDQEAEA